MSIFTPYRYNPATVGACQVTDENLAELSAIATVAKIKVKPRVGEWVIKKENGMYEIWQNKAFERKFSKIVSRELHPSNGLRAAMDAVTPSAPKASTAEHTPNDTTVSA